MTTVDELRDALLDDMDRDGVVIIDHEGFVDRLDAIIAAAEARGRAGLVEALREHRLSFPPRPEGSYASSALCSCGGFQWDWPDDDMPREHVWSDWWGHALATPAPGPDR